jgi:ABC-2 type transport system permease protein
MSRILAIAKAEYLIAVRSKAFIVGIVVMPILMGGGIVIQKMLEDQVDTTARRCAVVDRSGQIYPVLEEAAKQRNQFEIFEDGDGEKSQTGARFLLERYEESDDRDQTSIELSKRVESGELLAYLVINDAVFDAGRAREAMAAGEHIVAYHTETPTFQALPDWLEATINTTVRNERFERAQLDQELVQQLNARTRLTSLGLVEVSAAGEVKAAQEENKFQTFGVPVASMMLLFMLVMMTAPALLNQVLEEKMQRISEVLISAVSPFQLLMGKLLGTIFVALTLSFLYLGAVYYATWHFDIAHMVPPSTYAWFLLFLIMALFMFGSVFSAIGAACSEIKDAQTLMMPAMLMVMIPFFTFGAVMQSPSSTFSVAVSMFPPATPMIMMLRIALPPGPPAWQVIVSIVLTAGFTVLCVMAAGKIFRIGILSQGQAPTFGRLIKWVVSK